MVKRIVKIHDLNYAGQKQAVAKAAVIEPFVFLSSFNAVDPGTNQLVLGGVKPQTQMMLTKIRSALEDVGSSLENMVKIWYYQSTIENYWNCRDVIIPYFSKEAPKLIEDPEPNTSLTPELINREYAIEIQAIASTKEPKKTPLFYKGVKQKYSKGSLVDSIIYMPGFSGIDPQTKQIVLDGVRSQAKVSLSKIKAGLEDMGSSLENIVQITYMMPQYADIYYTPNMYGDLDAAMEEVSKFWKENCPELLEHPPAGTIIKPRCLARIEYALEFVAIASLKKPKKYDLYYAGQKQPVAKAVVVEPLVFLSSFNGVDPKTNQLVLGGTKSQTKMAWIKVKSALEDVGSSLENIAMVRYFLSNICDIAALMEETTKFWKENCPELIEHPPAGAFLGTKLACPEYAVEIEVTAGVG
jgi:enamine deaminase RidA (YjgF/YER057c/UK114 family)